jgi:hypothetical protein
MNALHQLVQHRAEQLRYLEALARIVDILDAAGIKPTTAAVVPPPRAARPKRKRPAPEPVEPVPCAGKPEPEPEPAPPAPEPEPVKHCPNSGVKAPCDNDDCQACHHVYLGNLG